jgi:L-ascorbate metabolism protein UlaG (beta-lactamase superfamily)
MILRAIIQKVFPTISAMIKKTLLAFLIVILAFLGLTFAFMQQRSFGKLPSGTRLEIMKKSPYYRDNSFQNVIETKLLAEGASYFGMVSKYFGKGKDREPVNALPSIKTNLSTIPNEQGELIWFGHSSYLLSIAGKKILADPVFSERPSPVQYAGSKSYPGTMVYNVADFPELDLVIISHDHYDHLDYNTILELKAKTKLFCVPLGVGSHLSHWGVEPSRIREFDWWQGDTVMPGVELICTPARHFSGRGFQANKTLWASFVLKTGGQTIFIGGDSGYDQSFKRIGEKYGPFDLAMLECGQYDVQWPDIHMMPEETVQASIDLQAKVLLPVHWGKFTLALHPWKDPVQRALKQAELLNVKVTTPRIGEPVVIGETYPNTKWWDL